MKWALAMQRFKDPFTILEKDRPYSHPSAPLPPRSLWGRLSWLQRIIGFVGILLLVWGGFVLFDRVSQSFTTEVPTSGGVFTEGSIGSPRFINPLLATSKADRDLTALVFAGLLKATPNGLEPELAESYSVSQDGLSYRFVLKQNLTFHDGTPVTADDVLFTISTAQNSALLSPHFANWEGVTVEKISDYELIFYLTEAYSPFLENVTLGILPAHIWQDATIDEIPFSEINSNPIGAGPYQVVHIRRDDAGIPREYELERFSEYTLGVPYIEEINLSFFKTEADALEAYQTGDIDSLANLSPESLSSIANLEPTLLTTPLPRTFGVFFNKNRNQIFTHYEVRAALDTALDRGALVTEVLGGYGAPIDSPIPLGVFPHRDEERQASGDDTITKQERFLEAEQLLLDGGWVRGENRIWERETDESYEQLSFTLTTSNTPEMQKAVQLIAGYWREFGADVTVEVFESGELTQDVIRPRRYDALFFGTIVGRELDLFAFWHASQREDPGLNIGLYTNITANKALEVARTETEMSKRLEALETFETEIMTDMPSIFIYSPYLLYVAPKTVRNISIEAAAEPSERFMNVHEWYIKTGRVWNL